jgi:hypothetical protein
MVFLVMASAAALPLALASRVFEWGTKFESSADPKWRVRLLPLAISQVKIVVVVLNSDSLLP